MANPYHSEATSLVRSHWPEATRPVGEMKFCYCGGKMTPPSRRNGGQCLREDCPRARLGYGSWHIALPKLQALWSEGQLENRYPHLNLYDLQNHVERNGQKHHERRADRRREEALAQPFMLEQEEQPNRQRRVWRKPRQPESPPPNAASSSTGGNPVKLGYWIRTKQMDSDEADGDGAGYDSEFTVLASDESGASIFGLRSALHEVEEDDELSDSSTQGDGEMAVAERGRVIRWRKDSLLLDDHLCICLCGFRRSLLPCRTSSCSVME